MTSRSPDESGSRGASMGDALTDGQPGNSSFGPFEFDSAAGLLYRGEQEILLPLRAARVLEVFLCHPGEVLSKDGLLSKVRKEAFVGEDSLTQAISMIRSALGDDPRNPTYIQTIPKRGYRFIAEVEGEAAVAEVAAPAEQVPPEEFSEDEERVTRLEREAKVLASVSSPNIATIHSLGEADGVKFPVLELVEGETLEQRLQSGPIAPTEALEIGMQIASA